MWFLYFLLLVGKKPIAKFVGAVTAAEGVLTGWIPGYLLLNGFMKQQDGSQRVARKPPPPRGSGLNQVTKPFQATRMITMPMYDYPLRALWRVSRASTDGGVPHATSLPSGPTPALAP